MNDIFRKVAHRIANIVGTAWAFLTAITLIGIWALTGPIFNFSNTWQLIINTTTTIVTFLMVFLIQNTQNRESKAIQLKLDELIRSSKSARDSMVNLEDLSDNELEALHAQFQHLHDRYSHEVIRRKETKPLKPTKN
jgi:low affinity Fe/Cu permease